MEERIIEGRLVRTAYRTKEVGSQGKEKQFSAVVFSIWRGEEVFGFEGKSVEDACRKFEKNQRVRVKVRGISGREAIFAIEVI